MTILIKNYKISSYQYGYTLAKKKGKNQWNHIGYYKSIEEAINNLFNYRINTELENFVIDFNDVATLELQKSSLLTKINSIKKEILRGV